jgi:hypothetical protein
MKNLSYLFLFLIFTFVSSVSFAQKIEEKLLYSGTAQVDAYSFYTDGKGNYGYIEYDVNSSQSRLVSNKGNSDFFDVVNADMKFDRDGNNYTTAYNFRKDTTYLPEMYYLLMNGQKVAELNSIDSYNAYINSANQYQCVITENYKQYICKYSTDKGLVKTGPYDIVKSIYAEITDSPYPMEGDDKMAPNLFKNKNGDYGYIVVTNNKASLVFGNDETKTDYTDILETSFTYDRNGALTYIAKSNGVFYSGYGNEFVVQGSTKWNDFNSVNPPVKFNSQNMPVYVTMDSVNESTYISRLIVGNDYYKVMNSGKTSEVSGYSGGIFDINVSGNNISFTGQTQIITKNPNGYDDYSYRSVNVINGVEGKGYYNQGVKRFNKSGAGLFSGSSNSTDRKVSLYLMSGSDAKVVSGKKYDGINDYNFINGSSKYYYIGTQYGDYEKGERDKSDVYIGDDFIGNFESLLGQGTDDGNYNSIVFSNSGDYAFVVQNANEKKVNGELTYDYTTEIVSNQDVETPSLPYKKDKFSYIDNLRFLKNGKLFYAGYLYPTDATMECFLVLDGKIIGKAYSSLSNFIYNKDNNTATFRASKGNAIYDVTVRF